MSAVVAAATAALLLLFDGSWERITAADLCVLVLLTYLFPYLLVTTVAFATASPERVRNWARREARGTVLQRYVYGTAPGPGVSVFIAAAALVVAVVWLPGHIGSAFAPAPRAVAALVLVAVAWACVAVSFAVAWEDYVYFAFSVMTTFGTADVDVTSREMRRTVTANATIAFVFNTVTVASIVSALGGV